MLLHTLDIGTSLYIRSLFLRKQTGTADPYGAPEFA